MKMCPQSPDSLRDILAAADSCPVALQDGGSEHLQVILMDLPSNDWNQVASIFFKPGAVAAGEAVLPVMVPRSFYAGPCSPPGSLHIGTSCDAAQWLQRVPPVSFKDSFCYKDAGTAASCYNKLLTRVCSSGSPLCKCYIGSPFDRNHWPVHHCC